MPTKTEALLDVLSELGFTFANRAVLLTPALRLDLALREFQTYAKLNRIAWVAKPDGKFHTARLEWIELPPEIPRYTGPVMGSVAGAGNNTEQLLDLWQTNKYRCPVVIEVWRSLKGKVPNHKNLNWWTRKHILENTTEIPLPPNGADNVWWWDEPKGQGVEGDIKGRVFVRDFTGRLENSACKPLLDVGNNWNEGQRLLVGDLLVQPSKNSNGPRSALLNADSVAFEIQPENFTGSPWDKLSPEHQFAYRIIRSRAKIECEGYFDALNAYDDALLSLGPCHWTLGHFKKVGEKWIFQRGELEAFLAYLKKKHPLSFQNLMAGSGLEPKDPWDDDQWKDKSILNTDQRKYESEFTHLVLNGDKVEPKRLRDEGRDYLQFLRSWHWFYRFQLATRTDTNIQRAMWTFARFRLRDILAAPAPAKIASDGTKQATLGDVFRSEQTVAYLLQWHIYRPGQLFVKGGPLSETLKKVIADAGVDLKKETNKWSNQDEERLLKALKEHSSSKVNERFDNLLLGPQLKNFPHPWIPKQVKLSLERRVKDKVFALDFSDLGPSPF